MPEMLTLRLSPCGLHDAENKFRNQDLRLFTAAKFPYFLNTVPLSLIVYRVMGRTTNDPQQE